MGVSFFPLLPYYSRYPHMCFLVETPFCTRPNQTGS